MMTKKLSPPLEYILDPERSFEHAEKIRIRTYKTVAEKELFGVVHVASTTHFSVVLL
jgi:hypothetical protein